MIKIVYEPVEGDDSTYLISQSSIFEREYGIKVLQEQYDEHTDLSVVQLDTDNIREVEDIIVNRLLSTPKLKVDKDKVLCHIGNTIFLKC